MKKIILSFTCLLITVSGFSQWSLTGNAGTTNSNFLGTTECYIRLQVVLKGYCHCGRSVAKTRNPLKINGRFFMGWRVKPAMTDFSDSFFFFVISKINCTFAVEKCLHNFSKKKKFC